MSRDHWEKIPAAEWKRRLATVRQIAVRWLATTGLNTDSGESDISGLILSDGEVAALLRPAIAPYSAEVFALVDQAKRGTLDRTVDFNAMVYNHAMEIAGTAYQFGVIAGCHLSWPIVEAMEAPSGPPRAKKTSRRAKGRAR